MNSKRSSDVEVNPKLLVGSGASLPISDGNNQSESGDVPNPYEALERFLEEGRRFKLLDDDQTPERMIAEYTRYRRCFLCLFAVACVLAIILISLEIFYFFIDMRSGYSKETEVLHIHSLCMTASVIVCAPFGVVIYRLVPEVKLWRLNYVHIGMCMTVTLSLFTVGLSYVIVRHDQFDRVHFKTFHAWLGLFLTLLIVLEFISGVLFFCAKYRAERITPKDSNVGFHRLVGELILVVGIGAWISGVSELSCLGQSTRTLEQPAVRDVIGIVSFILSLLLLVLIFHPIFRRRRKPVLESIYNNPNSPSDESSVTLISRSELLKGVKERLRKSRETFT